MTVEIMPVPPDRVARLWPLCEKYVADALKWANGLFEPEDIKGFCEKGAMQLWLAIRDDDVLAAVISEVTIYPRGRIVSVPFIGGKELRQWFRKMLRTVEAWSKEAGCIGMQGGARRGWGKLAQMEEVGVVLFKRYDLGQPLDEMKPASLELH